MEHKKIIELIMVKESRFKDLGADSRIKSKMRSHGNKLVTEAIKYLKNEYGEDRVEAFPEASPEKVKYFHGYVNELNSFTQDDNIVVKKMIRDIEDQFKSIADEPEWIKYELTRTLLRLMQGTRIFTNDSISKDKLKEFVSEKCSSVFRIYLAVNDSIPNMARSSDIFDIYINDLYNRVIADLLYDCVDEELAEDVSICTIVDDKLNGTAAIDTDFDEDGSSFPERNNLEYRSIDELKPGIIYNKDGSYRGFYTERTSKYIQ